MAIRCPRCQHENSNDTLFCSKCGGSLMSSEGSDVTKTFITPKQQLQKGNTFGERYTILEELGRGGMGVVYKAEDTKLKRTVALKFIPPELTHIPELNERFMREAQAAAALNHNNIVTIHEVNEHEGQAFIVMEYVQGQTLKNKIAQGPLSLDGAINIAVQIAEGLKKAHQKEIVHRDIKPGNIIVTDEGTVKILDFGLAKLKDMPRLTRETTTLGTVVYMSPEQTCGKEVDKRSDIWSLGVILHEMITGQLPFKGENHQAIMYAIMNHQPQPLSALRTGVPLELERMINKTLTKDPGERYQHVVDLQVDLKAILKKTETPGPYPSDAGKLEREANPKKISSMTKRIGLISVGLVVILTAAGILLFHPTSSIIDSLAILPFDNQSKDDNLAWLSTGIPETVITSLMQIPDLRVTSFLTLVERYGDIQPSVEEVKRHYNVRAVAKGRVAVVRQTLSIHIEIVDTQDQSIILAQQYHTEGMEGLFDLQKQIAQDITSHLQKRLVGDSFQPVFLQHTPDPAAYHHYLRGRHFWYKRSPRDLVKALDYFKKASEIDPEYALAWSGLADTYKLMRQDAGTSRYQVIPLAREAAEKALTLDDTLAETHTSMGGVFNLEQKYSEAEEHFRKAIELNPNYLLAYHWSGVNFGDATNYQDAIDCYEKALNLDPMSPIIASNLALEYMNLGNYQKAREILDQAIQLNPENSSPYRVYGYLYIDLGDHSKALEMAEKAFSLNPTSLFIIRSVVWIFTDAGRYERAIEILKGVMAQEPSFSRIAHMYMGTTYRQMNQYENALEHHLHAIDLDPLDIDSYWELVETYYYFKEWAKGADTLKKIVDLRPEEGWAYQMLGMLLGILGDKEEELACYLQGVEVMPVNYIELGCWHLNYGNYFQAVAELSKVEKYRPNYPPNSFYLFTAQFLTGDYEGAEKSLYEWLRRIDYKERDDLRQKAFPDGVVDRTSLVGYIRLVHEQFEKDKRPIRGSYEARMPTTLYCLSGDYESAIKTLEYAYETFPTYSYYLPWYIRFSHFKPLHNDPRFWELIKKLKLDPYFKKE